MKSFRIEYNAPVVLTFTFLSLAALLLGQLTRDWTTWHLFSVYRAPLSQPLTYLRMFTHVLGHAGYSHYMGNMMLLLVIGPPLEERYGSRRLLFCVLVTAFVSGVVQFSFFPDTALLGASGIVFMMIILASLSGIHTGGIPLTLLLVVVLYLGGELVDTFAAQDNISHLTHLIGGGCGALLGFAMRQSPPSL
jgi:rhomboid protease GluP